MYWSTLCSISRRKLQRQIWQYCQTSSNCITIWVMWMKATKRSWGTVQVEEETLLSPNRFGHCWCSHHPQVLWENNRLYKIQEADDNRHHPSCLWSECNSQWVCPLRNKYCCRHSSEENLKWSTQCIRLLKVIQCAVGSILPKTK